MGWQGQQEWKLFASKIKKRREILALPAQ